METKNVNGPFLSGCRSWAPSRLTNASNCRSRAPPRRPPLRVDNEVNRRARPTAVLLALARTRRHQSAPRLLTIRPRTTGFTEGGFCFCLCLLLPRPPATAHARPRDGSAMPPTPPASPLAARLAAACQAAMPPATRGCAATAAPSTVLRRPPRQAAVSAPASSAPAARGPLGSRFPARRPPRRRLPCRLSARTPAAAGGPPTASAHTTLPIHGHLISPALSPTTAAQVQRGHLVYGLPRGTRAAFAGEVDDARSTRTPSGEVEYERGESRARGLPPSSHEDDGLQWVQRQGPCTDGRSSVRDGRDGKVTRASHLPGRVEIPIDRTRTNQREGAGRIGRARRETKNERLRGLRDCTGRSWRPHSFWSNLGAVRALTLRRCPGGEKRARIQAETLLTRVCSCRVWLCACGGWWKLSLGLFRA